MSMLDRQKTAFQSPLAMSTPCIEHMNTGQRKGTENKEKQQFVKKIKWK